MSRPSREELDNRAIDLLLAFMLRHDSNCLDIGAHQGRFLWRIQRLAPHGRHLAWEPIPALAEQLRQQYASIDIRTAALSSRAGTADFVHVVEEPGYSGLRERRYPREFERESIPVAVERLDDVLGDDYVPSFIKLDIEGGELDALRGGFETISRHKPAIVFEHGPGSAENYGSGPDQVWDLLDQAGLVLFDLDGRGPFSREEFIQIFFEGTHWNWLARTAT